MVGGWLEVFWLPAVLCLAFFSVISLVVEGVGCVAWLFCWGWVFFAWPVFSLMFVVGEEGGFINPLSLSIVRENSMACALLQKKMPSHCATLRKNKSYLHT